MSASGFVNARYTLLMNMETAYGKSSHIWGRSFHIVHLLSFPRKAQGAVFASRNLPSRVRAR